LDREGYKETLVWCIENDGTYYDSAYIMVAKISGATLLTADNTLYEKARREIPTLHLKDY
jgi:predicted nucleic acid-binding protein